MYICIYSNYPFYDSEEFPRRDSKPTKRLQEKRAISRGLMSWMRIIALLPWSLFLGWGSLLGNLWMIRKTECMHHHPSNVIIISCTCNHTFRDHPLI